MATLVERIWKAFFAIFAGKDREQERPFADCMFGHTDMTVAELRSMRDAEIKDVKATFQYDVAVYAGQLQKGEITEAEYLKLVEEAEDTYDDEMDLIEFHPAYLGLDEKE